jgi:hypothetical protein
MGHDPGGRAGRRGEPGWRRPPTTVEQFIGKAPKRASFVMSHNRGEATNVNPASRFRISHVKTHTVCRATFMVSDEALSAR